MRFDVCPRNRLQEKNGCGEGLAQIAATFDKRQAEWAAGRPVLHTTISFLALGTRLFSDSSYKLDRWVAEVCCHKSYGIFCMGTIFVSSRVNSNCKVQLLKTPCPPTLGGVNVQRCAAARAARAKYLLGPEDSSSAPSTLPDRSTSTLTLTLTVPRMVFLADSSTSGITFWATSPWTGAPVGNIAAVFVSSS